MVFRDNSWLLSLVFPDDRLQFLYVFAFAFHTVKHAVAIGTDGHEIFNAGSYLLSQLTQRDEVMRFCKVIAKPPVTVFESNVAHLAFIIVIYLSLGCQQAAALALQM